MVQVFSTPLYYSRLAGTFAQPSNDECLAVEDELRSSTPISDGAAPPPSDDERRQGMMLWARTARLPIFLRH